MEKLVNLMEWNEMERWSQSTKLYQNEMKIRKGKNVLIT